MNKETSDQQQATYEDDGQNVQEANKEKSTPSLAEQVRTNPEIQRELDQRITQAITTAKAKWDEEAKLSDDERAAKALATREKALAEKEAAFTLKERTADIKLQLLEKRLPDVLADLIAKGTQNADEAEGLIDQIHKIWEEQKTEQIKAGARQIPAAASPEVQAGQETGGEGLGAFAAKNRKVK